MDGNACDVLLELVESELFERGDVLNRGDFIESNDGGGGFEFVSSAIHESCVELGLIGGIEAEAISFRDALHGGVLELHLRTFFRKEVPDEVGESGAVRGILDAMWVTEIRPDVFRTSAGRRCGRSSAEVGGPDGLGGRDVTHSEGPDGGCGCCGGRGVCGISHSFVTVEIGKDGLTFFLFDGFGASSLVPFELGDGLAIGATDDGRFKTLGFGGARNLITG